MTKDSLLNLTDNDRRLIDIIKTRGGQLSTTPSALGFLLYPEPKEGAIDHRWPQGMAMAGGKAANRLKKMGLLTTYSNRFETNYVLTPLAIMLDKQSQS